MKRQLNLIFLIMLCLGKAVCGIHDIRFASIGIGEGLSHSTINGICQDSSGYIWVATPDGLNRYDGNKFTSLIPDSLDHKVKAVVATEGGDVWCITNHALAWYSPKSERFTLYPFLNATVLNTLTPMGSGQLAIGTASGLYTFDTATRQYAVAGGTEEENISATTCSDGRLLAGTRPGAVVELAGGKLTTVMKPVGVEINVILEDRNNLLIGTEGGGLYIIDMRTHAVRRFGPETGLGYVRSLLVDSQNRLWAGTFTGLYILDPERRNIVYHEDADAPGSTLSHSSVRRLFADSQGGIWLGTYFGGLSYYHPQLNLFTTLRESGKDTKWGDVAGPMAEDSRGNIWIGTNNNGINIYTPSTGTFRRISRSDGLGSNDIKAILMDRGSGKAYVGMHAGGLSTVDVATRAVVSHRNVAESVYDIIPAADGRSLWLAILEGVILIDKTTFAATKVRTEGVWLTTDLMRDSKGRLWVGGEDGLAVYKEEGATLRRIASMPRLDCKVSEIFQSRITGNVWIATDRGLYRYDDATRRLARYSASHGMPGEIVYAVLEDPNANIWATTNRGLVCLNPSNGHLTTYSNRDGLQNRQFTDRSALYATNGLMYIGGTKGVTYFNPTILEKNFLTPAPLIEGVRLFNRKAVPGDDTGLLSVGLRETRKLTFDASQTNFTLDFTACDFLSRGDNTFQYMLDGLDKQWLTAPAGVRSVSYSNLPAGKYVFRLRAANNDGVWSGEEATIEIEILPPWYRRWWAILLMAVAVVSAVTLAIRYVWKRKSLEKMRKTQQEINEMKVRFFVNMSHELRTPLTLMLLPIEELLAAKPDAATRQKLTTIRNNTLRIKHIVNQLLDYRRAELGMFKLAVSERDINALLGDILEPYRSLAEKKNIRFHFNSTVQDPEVYIDANYVELIVNNLVTNAFKYTPDGGNISVDASEEGGRLRIDVADSGCGIPADKLDAIFTRFFQVNDSVGGYGIGLSLVKRLVELHHGTITVESKVGSGSRFTVVLPVGASAYSASERVESPAGRDSRSEDVAALLPVEEETAAVGAGEEENADGRKTILVVDDNAEILKYLSKALSPEYRVLTAANGTKAIETLGAEAVDMVISDVMMPDMDGVQLCRAIKRNLRTSHIPVILLSAKADVADRLDGLKVGADDYIAKPFELEELLAKVRNLLRTRERIIHYYSQSPTRELEPSKVAQNPLDEEFLKKAVKVMDEHMDDSQFSTDEFARQMCMSRSNLHLKMKALTGESTTDFIRRTRMRKAAELLKSRRYTVAEVSAMVGYGSPSYFATAFKGFYGQPPSSLL